jgi:glycosyltransferase involved in cell wall biosynthesis
MVGVDGDDGGPWRIEINDFTRSMRLNQELAAVLIHAEVQAQILVPGIYVNRAFLSRQQRPSEGGGILGDQTPFLRVALQQFQWHTLGIVFVPHPQQAYFTGRGEQVRFAKHTNAYQPVAETEVAKKFEWKALAQLGTQDEFPAVANIFGVRVHVIHCIVYYNSNQAMINSRKTPKKSILCIADGPDWIFNRHIEYLRRYLSDEFEILTAFRGEAYEEDDYDLIYPLEFIMVEAGQIRSSQKYVTGIRSFISWANWDFPSLIAYLNSTFQRVHTVSRELYDIFEPYLPGVVYLTHGLDTHLFTPDQPPQSETGRLRLGWAGNRNTYIKGYWKYIHPLGQLPGIELAICGFADQNLTKEEMPGFYNSIDAYVCASSFEGSNNTLLEAAAMERAIVTTDVGTVSEYLKDRESALIVERDVEQFSKAVLELRDNPELRLQLGKGARASLLEKKWDWENKAQEFRQFFRNAIEASVSQARRLDTHARTAAAKGQHLEHVLQMQNRLLRELQIGDAIRIYDLNEEIKSLRAEIQALSTEIDDIRSSETYLLVERIKASKALQALIGIYNTIKK